jgi:hypothetical protein
MKMVVRRIIAPSGLFDPRPARKFGSIAALLGKRLPPGLQIPF